MILNHLILENKKPPDYLKNQKYLPNYFFYELYGYTLLRIDNTQSNQPLITLQLYRLILYQLNIFVLLKIGRYFQETTLLSRLVSRQLLSLSVIFLQFSFPFYYICITVCFFKIFGGFQNKKTSIYLELIARDIRIFDTFYLPCFFILSFKINRFVSYLFTRIVFFIKPWFIFNKSIFRYTLPRIIMYFPRMLFLDSLYVSLFNKAFGGSI